MALDTSLGFKVCKLILEAVLFLALLEETYCFCWAVVEFCKWFLTWEKLCLFAFSAVFLTKGDLLFSCLLFWGDLYAFGFVVDAFWLLLFVPLVLLCLCYVLGLEVNFAFVMALVP